MIFLLNLGFLVNFLYFFFFFFFCGVGSVVIMMLHLNCIFFFIENTGALSIGPKIPA